MLRLRSSIVINVDIVASLGPSGDAANAVLSSTALQNARKLTGERFHACWIKMDLLFKNMVQSMPFFPSLQVSLCPAAHIDHIVDSMLDW